MKLQNHIKWVFLKIYFPESHYQIKINFKAHTLNNNVSYNFKYNKHNIRIILWFNCKIKYKTYQVQLIFSKISPEFLKPFWFHKILDLLSSRWVVNILIRFLISTKSPCRCFSIKASLFRFISKSRSALSWTIFARFLRSFSKYKNGKISENNLFFKNILHFENVSNS